jgi:hypothetical protein
LNTGAGRNAKLTGLAAPTKEACRVGPFRGAESGSLLDLGEWVFCCGPIASPV